MSRRLQGERGQQMAKQTGTVLEEPARTLAWESPSRHGDGNGRDRSLGNPKRWMVEILIMGNKIQQKPCLPDFVFCSLVLFCFPCFVLFLWRGLLAPGTSPSSLFTVWEQTVTVKTRFLRLSSIFHFPNYNIPSLWTKFKFSFPFSCTATTWM